MNRQMLIVFTVIAGTALALGSDGNCTSACSAYSACTSLNTTSNQTEFLKNSLLCDAGKDAALGKLVSYLSTCAHMDAAIEVADLLDIGWYGVSSLEAMIGDPDFWLAGCKWEQLAGAACIYYSVPDDEKTCTNGTVTKKNLFCEGECMELAKSCLNLDKYRHLTDLVTDFCKSVTVTTNTNTCFNGQVDQSGLATPSCSDGDEKAKNLTGYNITTTNSSDCFNVTGHQFCGITNTWTPRVSVVGGVLAMTIPALYVLIMIILLNWHYQVNNKKSFSSAIKDTYQRNKKLLYVQSCRTSENVTIDNYTEMKELIKNQEPDTEIHIGEDKATLGELNTARKHRKILCGLITLHRHCGLISMVSKLIVLPIIAVVWDIIDVVIDCYYFYKLERGGLIDPLIYRNNHVNNGILVFACLGAVKNVIVALCYFSIVYGNREEREEHGAVVLTTLCAVCIKIVFEDGPEIVLEYFYVDKFIVENPPWIFVIKDIVTALIYIVPLIKIATSISNDFNAAKELDVIKCPKLIYTFATIARICMSLAMIFRIVGMIIQYLSISVNEECFFVSENSLFQSPFNTGCLAWWDWVICVFLSLSVLTTIVPTVITLREMGKDLLK